MQIYSKTDVGKLRKNNQDAVFTGFLSDNSALAIVCDGMGGANAGNVASETAIKVISKYIENSYSNKLNRRSLMSLMKNAVISANIEIFNKASKSPELSGMGTTVVLLIVRNGIAFVCHVGDSRAYLVNDKIEQITRDHSIVQTLLESGKLTEEEAKVHPEKNIITRALGVENDVLPDCFEIPISVGETVFICTDGLSNFVETKDILDTFKNNDIASVPEKLTTMANDNGGGDNISIVTVTL